MSRRRRHPAEVKAVCIALVAEGASYSEAGRRLGVPCNTVAKWCRLAGVESGCTYGAIPVVRDDGKRYGSLCEAARALRAEWGMPPDEKRVRGMVGNIRKAADGRQRTAYGHTWRDGRMQA